MRRSWIACAVTSALLAGCGTTRLSEPEIKLVPVACVSDKVGPTPAGLETAESLLAISDGPTRYLHVTADWARRVARMAITEPQIEACRTIPAP